MSFFTEVIKPGAWFSDPARHSDHNLLEPTTRRKVLAIVADCQSNGKKVVLYETFRSQARQEQLFAQGATQLQHVGVHGYGLAADIVPLDSSGNPTWDGVQDVFDLIAHLAHVHELITGKDWGFPSRPHSFIDGPHVQYCSVKRQYDLFAGDWYPADDGSYNPYQDL